MEEDDLIWAADLVLAHRARPEDSDPEPPPPDNQPRDDPPQDAPDPEPGAERVSLPDELLLQATRAALPADLLAQLAAGRASRALRGSAGSGAGRSGNRRGRPLPSRAGRPDGRARIDIVATLRAAAPWQPIRRMTAAQPQTLHVRAEDIRLRRFRETSDRLLIFVVDASGSSALARLSEVKGAVELLLAQAYVRRDHVALIAFRGVEADVLLPPTRSLVQTKRRLAALPGGGGTPLAAGLQAALVLATQSRARGMTPSIAMLTDGRANIALDGRQDRVAAAEDADRMARSIRATGIPALLIDTGNRPQPALSDLAGRLGAPYLALPRADAYRLSSALDQMLKD